ncbi:MAG: hypothetical protein EOP47_07810 [Sphingobacteriaceae bacterium]|nr:MAG: hypothetical protein EOP47_07810 [Sphingobacteriaceae bacterium]
MKKVLIACALAFGVTATTKAQCPINDILTTRDIANVANMIEANTDCIKQAFVQNPEYQSFKTYVDFLYNNSRPWIYHTNPQKEKLFNDFYQKWGKDYPNLASKVPDNEEFKKDIAAMIATDPAFFKQKKETVVPQQYKQWLYVQDLNRKYGENKVLSLAVATSKIANLGTPTYIYAGNW